jgi:hypothetical protein
MKVGFAVCNVVYLERENAWSFEDVETSVIELRRIMFNTLYTSCVSGLRLFVL